MSENIKEKFGSWYELINSNPLLMNELKLVTNEIASMLIVQDIEVYPKVKQIFRAFREVEYDKCDILLLGMDPYINLHAGVPSACGLSFVTENGFVNPSLRVLMKVCNVSSADEFKDLMLSNNVLLLNAALTVEKGKSGSHLKHWKMFTELLLSTISDNKPNMRYILLGNSAMGFERFIRGERVLGNNPMIYQGPHPASFSYRKSTDYDKLDRIFYQLGLVKHVTNNAILEPNVIWN